MEFKFRAIDKQVLTSHPLLSSASHFSEQASRAGYSRSSFGRAAESFRNHINVREAIEREIEKEKIREEIIVAEIMRKRLVLETQVRREEMMLEREMTAIRRPERFSLFSPMNRYESRSIERMSLLIEEKLRYRNGRRFGGLETMPFHCIAEPQISETKPFPEAKFEENLSGVKRKAGGTLVSPCASELLDSAGLKKKPKEGWSCSICQVAASSEQSLNEHFLGKKHKAKEALGALRTCKNYEIGLFPKKTNKPVH